MELASFTIKLPFLCQNICQEFATQTKTAGAFVADWFAITMIGLELLVLVVIKLVRYCLCARCGNNDTESPERDNFLQVNQQIHFHNHARDEEVERELERQ